jgi:hypothetical protein
MPTRCFTYLKYPNKGRYFTLSWALELESCSEFFYFQAIAALFDSREEDLQPMLLLLFGYFTSQMHQ